MNQMTCALFNYIPTDLLILMMMEITLWFALAGLVWFLGWASADRMFKAFKAFKALRQQDNQAKQANAE